MSFDNPKGPTKTIEQLQEKLFADFDEIRRRVSGAAEYKLPTLPDLIKSETLIATAIAQVEIAKNSRNSVKPN